MTPMPNLIPFTPSDTNYRLGVTLAEAAGPQKYLFDVYWNERDSAFYLDLSDALGNPIRCGMKVVVGIVLGTASAHPFFAKHILKVVDTSGRGLEATYGDLGGRVQVVHMTIDEVLNPGPR